jgi:U4/U6.U5 tri-snRNP-associated protein 1
MFISSYQAFMKSSVFLQAKVLEEMDAEFGVGGLVEEEFKDNQKTYTSKDLAGLKVEHSQDRFKEGKTIILTLKDQGK